MASKQRQIRWFPYLIAVIGVGVTLLLWYVPNYNLKTFRNYFGIIDDLQRLHPELVLIFGLTFSILIAVMIRIAQIAKHRALILKQINEDLKKEIAERISAEENQQKLEVALLQGQKLQAIGTLAGGIAHDFNNLLYAIIGYVELAREDVDKDGITFNNLGKVLNAAHRGQELISRILSFSRRQHQHFDPINLYTTIEAVLALLRPTIPASVIIHLDTNIFDAIILGNQTQIHQVLVNIINNAVDAMDGEGNIEIKMTRVLKDNPFLKQFPQMLPQNYCKIEIIDTGHGMDQATIERIFEPFFTTKEVGKGTGLGLSIVHTIVKEHEGQIKVKSKLGQGTTFTILLPEQTMD